MSTEESKPGDGDTKPAPPSQSNNTSTSKPSSAPLVRITLWSCLYREKEFVIVYNGHFLANNTYLSSKAFILQIYYIGIIVNLR